MQDPRLSCTVVQHIEPIALVIDQCLSHNRQHPTHTHTHTHIHTQNLKKAPPAERDVDSWTSKRCQGMWARQHRTPRRHLFTPNKVAGGPDRDTRFKRYRVTSGHYVVDGVACRVTDDWLRSGNAHRALKASWVGRTEFSEFPDYVEETVHTSSGSRDLPLCGSISSLAVGPSSRKADGLKRALPLPPPVCVLHKQRAEAVPLPLLLLLPEDDHFDHIPEVDEFSWVAQDLHTKDFIL